MTYLFSKWEKLKEKLKNRFIFIFLDYDGTLAPIVKRPEDAFMPQRTGQILRALSKDQSCRLAIISGRALKDIRKMAGLDNVIYVGNHGLEIKARRIRFKSHISQGYRAALKDIKKELTRKLLKIKGAFVEDKGLTLSVHYRMADKRQRHYVKTIFHETAIHYTVGNKIKVRPGKMVLEIRPPVEWDKGRVVLWLIARRKFILGNEPFMPVYIGDDATDEDAFRALRGRGLTLFVGAPRFSAARYYVKNTSEVTRFLSQILKLKRDARICQR